MYQASAMSSRAKAISAPRPPGLRTRRCSASARAWSSTWCSMQTHMTASKDASSKGSTCASASTVSRPFAPARASMSGERSDTTGCQPSPSSAAA